MKSKGIVLAEVPGEIPAPHSCDSLLKKNSYYFFTLFFVFDIGMYSYFGVKSCLLYNL